MLKAYLTTLIMLLIFVNGKSQDASTLYIKGKDALKTNTSKAFNILDSAQTIADKAKNTNLSIKTRKLKGYAKYYEGDFSNAILAFGQALEIAKINDSTALQFDLCNALGACYKFVGDYGKSINYFNEAYQKALVLNDTGKVAKSTNNLGVLFRLNKDYKNSIKLLKEAEEIYRTQGDSISLGETLNNLGLSYSSIDSLEKARVYYNNSLRLKGLKGKTVSYAKTLNNIGLTEQLLKDYKKAQAHFEEAILVAEQANNLYQMASFKINLLDLQIGQNNTFNQEELLNSLEKTILSNGFVDLKPRLYLLKSNFAFTQKNYQKAIDFRDIYYKIQDSLYTEESKSAIANAKLIKEIEEKKNENLILSQQNQIQGLELKQKQLTNTVVFIGLVLLVLVSILLNLRFNRLKKLYQRLNKQENLLIKEKNAAQKANNYKSEFLANMSHEIRTPLSGIKGSINLLKEDVDKDEKLEILKILDQSSDTLMRIINDILDLSKIESGNITLSKESFDLKTAVDEVISSQSFVAKTKNIGLEVIIPQNLPKLSGDGTRLKQVLYNLVGNAIKFTQSGIVKLTIEKPDKNNSSSFIYLSFSISDTGVGISQNQIKNIFSPFTQANDQIAKTYGGTGLGLAISNQIISLMGGKLHVKSELDKGATFWFSIPFTISEETQQANNPNSSNINAKPLSKDIKILLVEDNKINQTIFKLSLDKIGYSFEVQENGKLGFEAYKKHQYPLIFMDIRMPEMDGITSTSYIRKFEEENHLKPSKIVAFTANAMIGDKEKYLEAGMDDFLAKPFNPSELKEIIEKYLVKKMTKLNPTFFALFIVLFSFFCSAQSQQSQDSLIIFNQLTRGFKLVYSQPNQAQARIDSAINYATKINYPYGKMKAFNVMGIVFDVKGKNDSAISFYRKSIAIAVRLNNNLSKAQTYNNVGLIYWNQHALDSALWYYKNAAEIFKNEKNNKGLANNYNNLGLIYDDLSLDTISKNYFIQALTIYKQLADTFGIGATFANLGRVYFNNPDSSIKYNKQAIPFMEKSNDQYGLSRVYNNLAGAAKEKNLFQEAIDYYKLSLKVKETTKDLYGIASTHNNIYAAYEAFASIDDLANIGLMHLRQAKRIAEKEDYSRLLPHIYVNFTNYFIRVSNYDSAYKYENKRYVAYKNLFNAEKEETIRELEVEFDVERKRNQIKVLKQEKEIETLLGQKRKSIIFILLISLLLIVGFGLFYFVNFKNKQKLKLQTALVSEKEKGLSATIEATENERIRIAKDLHDGVGQQLAALKLQFGGMQKRLSENQPLSKEDISGFEKLIDNTSTDIRNISHQMMPKTLQEFGLIKAVDQLLESTLKSSPINFKFEHFGFEERVSKKIEIAIYRILQELVKNVIVHSSANLLNVQLIKNQKNIVLIVEDNGVGFNKSKKSDGIGLLSLKSRVSDIHGEINFEPSPNSGTLVTARIPVS